MVVENKIHCAYTIIFYYRTISYEDTGYDRITGQLKKSSNLYY
jgi:hypothetical protein